MTHRPLVIAFDVIETLFPLEPIRRRLADAGQPGHVLDVWFARLLRDGFALAAAGGYRPFGDIAAGALRTATGGALDDEQTRTVLAGFAELDAHPDVVPAVRLARESGVRIVTLPTAAPGTRGPCSAAPGSPTTSSRCCQSMTCAGGSPLRRSTGTP